MLKCDITLRVYMNRLRLGAGNPMDQTVVTPEYKYSWF